MSANVCTMVIAKWNKVWASKKT